MKDLSKAPEVSPERIQGFYDDLSEMNMSLDPDPLELGPKRLNAKISECRTYLTKTESLFLEISQDLHWYKREHRRSQAAFDLSVQDLMSNDPETRSGRNITDRQAIANTKLRPERERISELLFAVEDLEAVLVLVRTKRADLKDIASRLRDQLKICQEEIGLGGRWGGRKSVFQRNSNGEESASSADLGDVGELLDGVLRKVESEAEEFEKESIPAISPESSLEDEERDIDALFSEKEGSLPASSASLTEVDKALEGLEGVMPKTVEVVAKKDPTIESILDDFDSV